MELLLTIGAYALWFLIHVLTYAFYMLVGGFCLAWGFKMFKDIVAWNEKRMKAKQVKKKNKEYEKKTKQRDEEMDAAAAAVAAGAM